ncbi:MAG: pyridoxal phosphate-dependent aminotransferase, partial [Gammaproteobacteria bacterium]|nr:pyridoxal phosphate-dependent aminotransferase [Gammaproteobacteria bacterium]
LFLPSPSWVSYAPQAELLGSRIFYVPSRVDDGYSFDLKAFAVTLEQSSNPNKLLILNSPNNPTGHMWSESSLRELAEFCREHKILVISDEIYFLVEHGDIKHNSLAKYYPQGTFILGGLSKHLSIGGWRVGVALLPDSESGKLLMQAVKVIASEIWSSVAAPIQYAALQAYSHDPEIEAYIKTCSRIHGIRTKFLYQKLTELGISCTKPLGAFYLTANFDAWADPLREIGVESSAQLARYLLDQHDLATLSTDAFGIPEKTLSLRLATSYLDMEKDEDSQRLTSLLASGMSEQEFMSEANHPNTHAAIGEFEKFVERCNDAYTSAARAL